MREVVVEVDVVDWHEREHLPLSDPIHLAR